MGQHPEFDAFWDALAEGMKADAKRYRIQQKQEQIRSVTARRCGNCHHWMKSSCKPEKERKEFKSCNSLACGDFEPSWSRDELLKQFTQELDAIKAE